MTRAERKLMEEALLALNGLTIELTGGYNHDPRTTALRELVEEALGVECALRRVLYKEEAVV
jgi:hypothetical protein